ncbi:MAG: CPBP family intramembrane metalloprotease [Candidatus Omnitrophica bacterium]|nr:CPBP family intramembrane metalloprotease [Candidatus Omnitrophota bacterium]
MIRDILGFFRKEKGYAVLFLVLLTTYGVFQMASRSEPKEPPATQTSPAVNQFRQAEKQVQWKIENAGSLQGYLQNRPFLNQFLRIIGFFAVGAFSLGLAINFFLIFNPAWRRSLTSHIGPPENTPWNISMLFKVVLLWIAASLALNFFFLILREYFFPQFSLNFYLLLHTTISDIFCVAFIIYVVQSSGGHWRDLGLWIPRGKAFKEVMMGWGGYLAVLPIFFAVLIFLTTVASIFNYEPPAHPLVTVFLEEDKKSPWLISYSIFLAGVLAPIFEEIFFRGFCYTVFKKRWGMGWAMVVSSAFFAFIHQNSFAFWPIFILGIGMAYLYEKRRTLLPCMVLHITHNSLFLAYFFFAKKIISQEMSGPF